MVFPFRFERSDRANIADDELEALKEITEQLLARTGSSTRRYGMVRYSRFVMKTRSRARKSRILEAVHETAGDLHRQGFIDKRKMRKFDALRLDPIPQYNGQRIRALRDHLQVSQAVLAAVLNTSLSTVRKWEDDDKHPS